MDISNGEGIGVSLFVQGCPFRCLNCFNQDTWDYSYGNDWTPEIERLFLSYVANPHVVRVSLLGGEPLYYKNLDGILHLVSTIKGKYPHKAIWLYTGYEFEDIFLSNEQYMMTRQSIVKLCDVIVDGQYIDSLKDMNLKFRGSSNQRVIDVPKSINQGQIVLYKSL